VTHDLSEIITAIDRVVVMKDGRILADGPKREVLDEGILSEAYGTKVFLSEREGRFTAWC
jgi:iron complex transport system ATP-binding protein